MKSLAPGGVRAPADVVPSPSDLAVLDTSEAGAKTCTCPPGWRHRPDCPEVTGKK